MQVPAQIKPLAQSAVEVHGGPFKLPIKWMHRAAQTRSQRDVWYIPSKQQGFPTGTSLKHWDDCGEQ